MLPSLVDTDTFGTHEDFADLIRPAEVGHGIGNGVVVFEPEQRRELFLIEFLDTNAHVMGQHEVEEDLDYTRTQRYFACNVQAIKTA